MTFVDDYERRERNESIFPDQLAVRMAATPLPGRSRVAHIECVWCNFCDFFLSREDFDRQVSAYMERKQR